MKQPISDMFDKFSAEELDMLLEETLQTEPLDEVTKTRIEATVLAHMPKAKRPRPRRILILAACLILLFALGFGAYAEVREYNAAIRFFDEYDLSTDGLSRGEIKAVFRDITTGSFTYSVTAEVLRRSLSTDQVPGYEISQENPTPEEIEDLWNYKNGTDRFTPTGIHYEYHCDHKLDEHLGFTVHDKSYFEKYDGDSLLWSVSVTEFWISDYAPVSGGVVVYGSTPTHSSRETDYAWMMKVDDEGHICWKRRLDNGFEDESIEAVLENSDGTYAVFTRGDLDYFCLSHYTAAGEVTHFYKTEVGNYGIHNAAPFDGGYLVQLVNYTYTEPKNEYIVKVDYDGHITDAFTYTDSESDYFITDMIEWGGKIYLSAYAVPKLPVEHPYETYWIDKQLGKDIFTVTSEELTPVVRDNYTAMLLVCDPKSGTPQAFYSAKGSLGGNLAISETGTLLWDVKSIVTTSYHPLVSSFPLQGTCDIYRYTFNQAGTLLSQEKTGETTQYAR